MPVQAIMPRRRRRHGMVSAPHWINAVGFASLISWMICNVAVRGVCVYRMFETHPDALEPWPR
jgi:hypothetical protein